MSLIFLIIYIEGGLMVSSEYKKGIFLALGAYILWGDFTHILAFN